MLRVAVPNKGMMSEPARAMLTEAGYLRSASVARPARARPRQRRRVLLPASARHRHLRRRGHPRPGDHRARHAARLGRERRRGPAAGLRAIDLPAGCAEGLGVVAGGPRRAHDRHVVRGRARGLPGPRGDLRPGRQARRCRRERGGPRRRRRRGRRRRHRHHAAQGRARAGRRPDPGLGGRRHPPDRGAAGARDRDLRPPPARRDGRPLLRAGRLRHPHREASSRRAP